MPRWASTALIGLVLAGLYLAADQRSLRSRVKALEIMLKESIFDEAVAACNKVAGEEGDSNRFSRRDAGHAYFRLQRLDNPAGPSAELWLFAGSSACTFDFFSGASLPLLDLR